MKKTKKLLLHHRLRSARLRLDLTLREVSDMADSNISNPYVSQLERGLDRNPSPHILRALCRVLQLNYMEMMKLAGYITQKDLKK